MQSDKLQHNKLNNNLNQSNIDTENTYSFNSKGKSSLPHSSIDRRSSSPMITPIISTNKGLNRNRSVVNTNNLNNNASKNINMDNKNAIDYDLASKKLKSSKTKDRQEYLNEIHLKNNKTN